MPDAFYDELAPFYHLLYGDWERAIASQGDSLGQLLDRSGVPRGSSVLDSASGIGTQALGLAAKGYQLSASDLSAGAIARLAKEAAARNLTLRAYVDDLRSLAGAKSESMDAVIACDNSLPHLLSDEELLLAFQSALRVLRPGGIGVYSVRDYALIPRTSPSVRPHGLHYDGGSRFMATQVWEWEGDQYALRMYLTRESAEGDCTTRVLVTRYYAVTIARLIMLMREAGFESIERFDDVLFQPIIVGRKSS
jgi:SAM-dependent methyltransferase